jgi:hypothetical protein
MWSLKHQSEETRVMESSFNAATIESSLEGGLVELASSVSVSESLTMLAESLIDPSLKSGRVANPA